MHSGCCCFAWPGVGWGGGVSLSVQYVSQLQKLLLGRGKVGWSGQASCWVHPGS